MNEHDCWHVPEITCPYCGWSDSDSWEFKLRDGDLVELDCGRCEKAFDVVCAIEASYTSIKKT